MKVALDDVFPFPSGGFVGCFLPCQLRCALGVGGHGGIEDLRLRGMRGCVTVPASSGGPVTGAAGCGH